MNDAAYYSLAITALVVFSCLTWVCGRKARRILKAVRSGWGNPLLHGVSEDDLKALSSQWPLRDRWPVPFDENGNPALEPYTALAYSRMAEHTKTSLGLFSEGLVIFGGAWLGLTLPRIWQVIAEAWTEGAEAGPRIILLSDLMNLDLLEAGIPLVILLVAIATATLSHDYGIAARAYEEAAVSSAAPAPTAIEPAPASIVGRLRQMFR